MIVCPHCGFMNQRKDFNEHPEYAVSNIYAQMPYGKAYFCIPILICPSCLGTEVPGKFLKCEKV